MSLRNFDFKEEFFFAKRVIAAHMSLKHLIPVILWFLSILGATDYVRHKNVVQKTKIPISTCQKLGVRGKIFTC